MQYQLYIFDMDGTILDTLADLAATLNHALRASGFPERTTDEVRRFVGNGVRKLVERSVPPGTGLSAQAQVYDDFTAYYQAHCADHTRPYDGIPEALRFLRAQGAQTAVVSNKVEFGVKALCKQYFDGLFDACAGDRDGVRPKPAPDTVNGVLRQLGVERSAAVYIGDSEVDIQTAENAGLPCLSVAWGFRSEAFLREHGAQTVLQRPEELCRF